jgi:hypothetical protein
MLSAFENVGWPDPRSAGRPAEAGEPTEAGGHGGELLRGGYAQAALRTPAALRAAAAPLDAAAAAELFRRMTTRRLSLLRPRPARAYLASLAPPAAALARGPLAALDDFYLVNRAGRWSAAARQAFAAVAVDPRLPRTAVQAAGRVLRDRMSDRLHRDARHSVRPAGSAAGGAPARRAATAAT